jgi:hypothetical protein
MVEFRGRVVRAVGGVGDFVVNIRIQSNGESVLGIGREKVKVSGGGWGGVCGSVGSRGSHVFSRELRMWVAVNLHL